MSTDAMNAAGCGPRAAATLPEVSVRDQIADAIAGGKFESSERPAGNIDDKYSTLHFGDRAEISVFVPKKDSGVAGTVYMLDANREWSQAPLNLTLDSLLQYTYGAQPQSSHLTVFEDGSVDRTEWAVGADPQMQNHPDRLSQEQYDDLLEDIAAVDPEALTQHNGVVASLGSRSGYLNVVTAEGEVLGLREVARGQLGNPGIITVNTSPAAAEIETFVDDRVDLDIDTEPS
jgi:hypothetical protein